MTHPARSRRGVDMRAGMALGLFLLSLVVLAMIFFRPELTKDQGFMFLAQLIIGTGLIGGAAAFAFTVNKPDPPAPPPHLAAPPAPDKPPGAGE